MNCYRCLLNYYSILNSQFFYFFLCLLHFYFEPNNCKNKYEKDESHQLFVFVWISILLSSFYFLTLCWFSFFHFIFFFKPFWSLSIAIQQPLSSKWQPMTVLWYEVVKSWPLGSHAKSMANYAQLCIGKTLWAAYVSKTFNRANR